MSETGTMVTVTSPVKDASKNPWWEKIDDAEARMKDFWEMGDRMIRYYEANYYKNMQDNMTGLDQVYVNVLYEFVKVMVPFLYARDPEVLTTPKKPGAGLISKFLKDVLQYTIKEIDLKRTAKRVLQDALLPGWGVFRPGYSFEAVETTINPEEFEHLSVEKQKLLILHPKNKARKDGDPYVFQTIKKDLAWVVRWPWKKFIVDPMGTSPTDLTDHRFIIFKSLPDDQELKAAGYNYPNMSAETSTQPKGDLYEVWDRLKRKRLLFLRGENDPINGKDGEDWPKWVELFPAVVLAFNEVPDKPLPIADGTIMESQIREKNYIRTQQVNHRKRFNRRYTIPKGMMDPAEILKWESNIDGSMVQTNKEGVEPRPVMDAPLPADVYNVENRIDQDLARLSGSAEIQRGAASTVEQTATQSNIQEQRLQLRTSERQDVVETAIRDVVRMLAQIIQANYDFPHFAEIVGENGVVEMQEFTKEQLDGEFDIDIHIGSMIPVNRQLIIRQAENAFNLLFGKGFNDQELGRWYLEALEAPNIDLILTPPAPPVQPGMEGAAGAAGGLITNGGTVNPALLGAQAPTPASEAIAAGAALA